MKLSRKDQQMTGESNHSRGAHCVHDAVMIPRERWKRMMEGAQHDDGGAHCHGVSHVCSHVTLKVRRMILKMTGHHTHY